jgi:hypothetical protein
MLMSNVSGSEKEVAMLMRAPTSESSLTVHCVEIAPSL